MYSQLFQFKLPEFLQTIFGIETITIYTYPLCILIGSLIAIYCLRRKEKENQHFFFSIQLLLLILCAAFSGGKLFLFFEKPLYYINNPNHVIEIISGGYVFYGSLITCIITLIIYLKRTNKSILISLDIIALSVPILHAFGRLGCFFAGCCYGKPSELGIIFPKSHPNAVHPTQLYEASFLLLLFILLNLFYKRIKFDGTVFIVYIISYGIGRFIIEYFRGDDRGHLINNIISHSQFTAMILIALAILMYFKLKSKKLQTS